MEPKERVKLKVYQALLEEEKRKNKKYAIVGVSLFVIGVFTDTAYKMNIQKGVPKRIDNGVVEIYESSVYSSLTPNESLAWEHLYEKSVSSESNVEISPEDLLVSDLGI